MRNGVSSSGGMRCCRSVKVEQGKITDRFSTFVNPQEPIPFKIEELTGISDEMVLNAPVIEDILPEFLNFCEGCVLIAHNASFDAGFIEENCRRMGIETEAVKRNPVTLHHARRWFHRFPRSNHDGASALDCLSIGSFRQLLIGGPILADQPLGNHQYILVRRLTLLLRLLEINY